MTPVARYFADLTLANERIRELEAELEIWRLTHPLAQTFKTDAQRIGQELERETERANRNEARAEKAEARVAELENHLILQHGCAERQHTIMRGKDPRKNRGLHHPDDCPNPDPDDMAAGCLGCDETQAREREAE